MYIYKHITHCIILKIIENAKKLKTGKNLKKTLVVLEIALFLFERIKT